MATIEKDFDADPEYIDKVLQEGIECCAEVEVGEVVQCLMDMFENIQELDNVKDAKLAIGPDKEQYIDSLLISLFVSEIATLTLRFKKRERTAPKA